MNTSPQNKQKLPFPPSLMAVQALAMIAIGLCVAELFPKHGNPLGLIPTSLQWPLLGTSAVVAIVCASIQIRILRKLRETQGIEPPQGQ